MEGPRWWHLAVVAFAVLLAVLVLGADLSAVREESTPARAFAPASPMEL